MLEWRIPFADYTNESDVFGELLDRLLLFRQSIVIFTVSASIGFISDA